MSNLFSTGSREHIIQAEGDELVFVHHDDDGDNDDADDAGGGTTHAVPLRDLLRPVPPFAC